MLAEDTHQFFYRVSFGGFEIHHMNAPLGSDIIHLYDNDSLHYSNLYSASTLNSITKINWTSYLDGDIVTSVFMSEKSNKEFALFVVIFENTIRVVNYVNMANSFPSPLAT
jgi:hypothetical protein